MKHGPFYFATSNAQPQPESTVLVELRTVPATGTETSAEHLEVNGPSQLVAAILERYPSLRADQNIVVGLHLGCGGLKLSVHAYGELGPCSQGLVIFLSGLAPCAEARFFHHVTRGLTSTLLTMSDAEGEVSNVQS